MCDTVPGRVLLLSDRKLEARHWLLERVERDGIRVMDALDDRLESLELRSSEVPFELLRLRVPEGSESWAAGRLHEHFRTFVADRPMPWAASSAFMAAPEHLLHTASPGGGSTDVTLSTDHQVYREMVGFGGPCPCEPEILVIDSGVAPTAKVQPVAQRDFTPGAADAHTADDQLGHGTVVCEIIHDLLPNAQITVYKVADERGGISEWDLLAALAAESEATVINLSMVFGLLDRQCPTCGRASHTSRSSVFEYLADAIAARPSQPMLVAAAGNQAGSDLMYPARFANFIAISSTNRAGALSRFSNHGRWAHDGREHAHRFGAPGGEHDESGQTVERVASSANGTEFAGTSFACAYATAVTAAFRCYCQPALPPPVLRDVLRDRADATVSQADPRLGNGLIRH